MSTINKTSCDGIGKQVKDDESYYILLTATTAASTDIALQAVAIILE